MVGHSECERGQGGGGRGGGGGLGWARTMVVVSAQISGWSMRRIEAWEQQRIVARELNCRVESWPQSVSVTISFASRLMSSSTLFEPRSPTGRSRQPDTFAAGPQQRGTASS